MLAPLEKFDLAALKQFEINNLNKTKLRPESIRKLLGCRLKTIPVYQRNRFIIRLRRSYHVNTLDL